MSFPELTQTYFGPNAAHKKFRTALSHEKVLFFVIAPKLDSLFTGFQEKVEETRQELKEGQPFALGMVTHSISNTAFEGLHITENEVVTLKQFRSQFFSKVYADVHRVFSTYLLELDAEIVRRKPAIMKSSQKEVTFKDVVTALENGDVLSLLIARRQHDLGYKGFKEFMDLFEGMGLPIVSKSHPERDELIDKCILLAATRNIIEHNLGIVDEKFLKRIARTKYRGDYEAGSCVEIDKREVALAVGLVGFVSDDLNRRAVEKFDLDS